MKIGKNHEAYLKIKNLIKKNNNPNLTISDDLQVLKIALLFNLKIDTLLYCYELEYHEDTKELLKELIKRANASYEISLASYNAIQLKENHAGIIASIQFNEYKLQDLKNKEFIFVLDRLEIPGNIGTIYRTLESIKCDAVILVDPVSKINNEKITSSSRGCNLIIPTVSTTYDKALNYLLNNNYDIFLGEPELGLSYQDYDYKGKVAIVVGNERFGINPDWYNHKNKKVFIPMEGSQNSLNVSVAASVLAYECYMKRKKSA